MGVDAIITEGGEIAKMRERERRAIEQEAFYNALNRLDEEDHDRLADIIRLYTTVPGHRSPIQGISRRGMLELLAKLGIYLSASEAAAVGAVTDGTKQ